MFAAVTYNQSVTSMTSITITAATSGMPSKDYAVWLVDGNSVKYVGKPGSGCGASFCFTIDSYSYELHILSVDSSTFPSGFTGTIYLKSAPPYPDSTGSSDFALEHGSSQGHLRIVGGTSDSPIRRTVSGVYASDTGDATATVSTSSGCTGTVYAYISANAALTFGHSKGSSCITAVTKAVVASGQLTGYPSGVVAIGTASQGLSGSLVLATDDRPWACSGCSLIRRK
jgi:hypothetical protein